MLLIGEVATLATDYLVALFALVLAWRLWAVPATRAMAVPFLWLALAAMAGGTFHGWRATLGQAGKIVLWGLTSVAMAALSFSLLVSYGRARTPARWHAGLRRLALLKLVVLLALVARDPGILWLIVDYGVSMLVLAAIYAFTAARARASLWMYAAVALSLAGALIQRLRIAPSPSFNHNDLYHLVQMASMACFYRSGSAVVSQRMAA
jgi:hypothetical protein